jgi:hypothetical protein
LLNSFEIILCIGGNQFKNVKNPNLEFNFTLHKTMKSHFTLIILDFRTT